MSESRSVAIVIPSWNSIELLPRCLASLANQGADLEPMVVDNGSSDGSVRFLEEHAIPHVSLPGNVGFAAAVNLGVARTTAPAVLVLNVDTELETGCVGRLVDALARDRSLGGVQPRILQAEAADGCFPGRSDKVASPRVYSSGQALTKDGRALELGMGDSEMPGHRVHREIFGVCGAACLLRRDLFRDLGGYDERYFAFYEDVDLNVRARIAGWRFEYVPEAAVWHIGNASWKAGFRRPSVENARLVARNRLATQIKFMPLRSLVRIVAVEVGSLARATVQRRFRATLRGKLEALKWSPALLRERKRLAAGGRLDNASAWLGKTSIPACNPFAK